MKKSIFNLFLALITMFTMSSCGTQFGLAYNVGITGDGDGQFEVTFPQGTYAMDGTAKLALNLGDTVLFNEKTPTTKAEVLAKNNKKQIAAMKAVNDSIANQFDATSASGTYDVTIQGKVTEIGTGLTFEVNRHLTNRDVKRAPALKGDTTPLDLYPYIK